MSDTNESPTWGLRSSLHALLCAARLLPSVRLSLALRCVAGVLLFGSWTIGYVTASRFLVDATNESNGAVAAPLVASALLAGLYVAREGVFTITVAWAETLGYWINRYLRSTTMAASLRPDHISHLENPAALDLLADVRKVGSSGITPGAAIAASVVVVSTHVQAIAAAAVLSTLRFYYGPLLLVVVTIVFGFLVTDFVRAVSVVSGTTTTLRRAAYMRDLALDGGSMAELRVFRVHRWLLKAYDASWASAMRQVWDERRPVVARAIAGVTLFGSTTAYLLFEVASAARAGEMSLGTAVMYGQASLAVLPVFVVNMRHLNAARGSAVVPSIAEFKQTALADIGAGRSAVDHASHRIEFRDVSFTYPGAENPVLRHVSFTIEAGRSLGIVGLNGSGKSTIIKLMCGLYRPDSGSIMLGGVDSQHVDLQTWRRAVVTVFQTPTRLPLTFAQAIASRDLSDGIDRDLAVECAETVGLGEVLASLPKGIDTPLMAGFDDGTELSSGQWQRLSAARVQYELAAGAKVVLLDEPTANLDLRVEAAFYRQFAELTGVTRVLVSHRLASLRDVDDIVLLDAGRLVESGSHETLMAADGRYRRLYAAQRGLYVDDNQSLVVDTSDAQDIRSTSSDRSAPETTLK